MVAFKIIQFSFLFAVFTGKVSSAEDERILVRLPRQSHGKNGHQDQSSAETGFLGGGGVENSKYFQDIYVLRPDPMEIEFGHVFENPHEWEQRYEKKDFNKNRHQGKLLIVWFADILFSYQHLPEHDKYEFGHRRGNEHHVVERYEKAIPHDGQFKTKVRWADKKGGHGEHYWDYNHAGHGGNGHGGQNDGDKNGGYSDHVPIVYSSIQTPSKHYQKRQLENGKRTTLEDVESPAKYEISESDEKETSTFIENFEKEIEGIEKYDVQKETGKSKRNSVEPKRQTIAVADDSHLFFDVKSGKVVDELTGKKYILQPVN